MLSQVWTWIRSLARWKAKPPLVSEAALDYGSCCDLLAAIGIWAPRRPGPRNPRLRWGTRQGEPIRGAYLNQSDSGLAYFTLNSRCDLEEDESLWSRLPGDQVAKAHETHKNIYPQPGRERDALQQLFLGKG